MTVAIAGLLAIAVWSAVRPPAAIDPAVSLEMQLTARVERLLDGFAGGAGARVTVRAELDMARVTVQQDTFDPDGQVLRSSGSAADETLTYEINRTRRTEVLAPGRVRRLAVAVAVPAPRSTTELRDLEALVAATVGADPSRGDQITVEAVGVVPGSPIGGNPWRNVTLGLLAAIAVGGGSVLLRRRRTKPANTAASADVTPVQVAPSAPASVASIDGAVPAVAVKTAAELADHRPGEGASVLRGWLQAS